MAENTNLFERGSDVTVTAREQGHGAASEPPEASVQVVVPTHQPNEQPGLRVEGSPSVAILPRSPWC